MGTVRNILAVALLLAVAPVIFANHKFHPKQTQPDPARVSQIQDALVGQGRLTSASGLWDKTTITALRQMAGEHNWQTCIVPDARVINILGLGSGTAGIAAPPPSEKQNPLDRDLMKYAQDHPEVCTQ